METIGLLGGMAWPSTTDYYRILNQETERLYGKQHSAKCILYSYDFYSINPSLREKAEILQNLSEGIRFLTKAGVDLILICSNSMHYFFDSLLPDSMGTPILDVRDCVGKYLVGKRFADCLLLGTKFTMQQSFYSNYLQTNYHLRVILPHAIDQAKIDEIIFNELVNGIVTPSTCAYFQALINQSNASVILLACTELNLISRHIITTKALLDSTAIHSHAAFNYLKS